MFSALPPDQYLFHPELLRMLPGLFVAFGRARGVGIGSEAPTTAGLSARMKLSAGVWLTWGIGLLIAFLYFLLKALLESLALLPFRLPMAGRDWFVVTLPISMAIDENEVSELFRG